MVAGSRALVTGPDGQRWENYVVLADAHPDLEGKIHAEPPLAETSAWCSGKSHADGAHTDAATSTCCA